MRRKVKPNECVIRSSDALSISFDCRFPSSAPLPHIRITALFICVFRIETGG
jgi:hypothetical protein